MVGNIDINESIQETHSIVTSNCNKKTNELANNYIQNTLDTSKKESNSKLNFLSELKEMRKSYVKNIIVGQLNINSLRNKFLSVKELLSHNLDLLVINETKLDDSFPNAQFQINGYKCLRKDRNIFGGGLCLYINEDIPSKQIYTKLLEGLESICIEMNLRKRKWLVIGIYKPPQSCSKMFIEKLSNQLNDLHTNYDILLLGDFNMTPEDLKLQVFCDTHDLENLIKEPTCFKGKNPSCIDLILTNQKQLFMKSRTFITGISDFHSLTTSIMKLTYTKGNPKIKFYRDYKNFDNDLFKVGLENSLTNLTDLTYTSFEKVFFEST